MFARDQRLPGLYDPVLVKEPVDDVRMRPVLFRHTALKVCRHVVDMSLELAVQRRAEPAAVCPPLPHRPHDHFGMWACLTAMGRLVVLVEGIGAPEALVTAIARVFARAVVELLLVPLPVELALERLITRRAPELGLARRVRREGDRTAHRVRREAAVTARAARYCRYGRSILRRRLEGGIHVVIAKVL